VRALIVGVLFTLTVTAMPEIRPATADGFGLVTIALCVIILAEYGFSQPALVEFRFAPPYNRWRFFTLMAIILGFVVLCGNAFVETPFNVCIVWLAEYSEQILDFFWSPAVVMNGLLEDEVSEKSAEMIIPMAALGYMITITSIVTFAIYLSLSRWPAQDRSFHFWSNLPTLQTVQPDNASQSLKQIGILSIALALVLPYMIPFFIKSFSDYLPIQSFVGDFTLFWIIALTTWIPLVCFMRGFALIKVSRLIERDLSA